MGSYLTHLWWGGDPDIPDPLSGLSRRDIHTVRTNWATVYAKSQVYGMELFLRLFRRDPNTQKFFKTIDGLSEDRIKQTIVFKAHVQSLMASLNTAVVNLDQPAVVVVLMNKIGTSHHARHIEVRHFEVLKEVLVDFITNDLKLSDSALGSWGSHFALAAMGSYITRLWWGGDPDSPDSFSGLSRRDIYTVQTTWATINAQSGMYGMELFLRLFRNDPHTQTFFKNIEGMPEERIRKSVVFKAHVQNLMASFNTAVVNVHTPEVVAALMNKLGTSHHKRHIQVEHFEEFKRVLINFFINDLKLSGAQVDSWSRFIDFAFKNIYDLLKDEE